MSVTIATRRDESADWMAADPVLALGEIGWDTELKSGKVGDGITRWSLMPFSLGLLTGVTANAASILYNNAVSKLAADQVQAAIDELVALQRGVNLQVNGGFEISQRGTTFMAAAHGEKITDLTRAFVAGSNYQILSADADRAPDKRAAVGMKITPAVASEAALLRLIELTPAGSALPFIVGETYTLSFWAKAAAAVGIRVNLQFVKIPGDSPDSVPLFDDATQAVTTEWQKFTYTFPINSPALATNIAFQTYVFLLAPNVALWIAEMQVERGPRATPFEIVPLSVQLQRCERYYERNDTGFYLFSAQTGAMAGNGYFRVRKRIVPTMTVAVSNVTSPITTAGLDGYVVSCAQVPAATARVVTSVTASAEL